MLIKYEIKTIQKSLLIIHDRECLFHGSLNQFRIEHDIENVVKLFTPSHNSSNTIVTVNDSPLIMIID